MAKNLSGHIMGAFSEVLLFQIAVASGQIEAVEHMRSHMFRKDGGGSVDEVDLIIEGIRIDAKTFDISAPKRFCAINARKHKELEGNCEQYFVTLTRPYSRSAIVGHIPFEEVSEWDEFSLGEYGDPSRNLSFEDFENKYDIEILRRKPRFLKKQVLACASNSATKRFLRNAWNVT